MPRTVFTTLLSVACVSFAGCASGSASYPGEGLRASGPVTVQVENDSQQDMEIHLARDATRTRLGVVLRNDSRTFTLEGVNLPQSGRVQFALGPLGGVTQIVTEAVQVQGGETVVVDIPPEIELTRVQIRR